MAGERRRSARQLYRDGFLPPGARVRPGLDVVVVDLSDCGALVEGPWRFRPGGRCELALVVEGRELTVRSRVVRCYVARLDRGLPVRYRTALAFDGALAVPRLKGALDGYELRPAESGRLRPG